MIFPELARFLNALALAVISAILAGAFAFQFALGEVPCPLCLLQRGGLIAAGLGFLLNLRFGIRPAHYGVALLGSVAGAAVSLRQILLHIAPGDPGFGSAVLGLHMYTWAFVAFVGLILGIGVLLILGSEENTSASHGNRNAFATVVIAGFVFILAANLLFTLLECGLTQCPDDPTGYLILDWWRGR